MESACWWWPHRDFIMVSERPHTIRTEQIAPRGWGSHRLHSEDGPAVGWEGWGVYAWHGVRVPAQVITAPHSLTVEQINAEPNAEVRRVMVERYGAERYLRASHAAQVHADTDGLGHPRTLWRLPQADDEPLVMVEVANSTPEPDGSRKRYMLRVPPSMRTCQEAVAWTFGVEPEQYRLAVET
ncbi:MAG: hypothetical protein IT306_29535 [Chloroflexi bacterium]|nr:hypothetical protein [Chloroflexota bacterium]